jgi:hypothetical protein
MTFLHVGSLSRPPLSAMITCPWLRLGPGYDHSSDGTRTAERWVLEGTPHRRVGSFQRRDHSYRNCTPRPVHFRSPEDVFPKSFLGLGVFGVKPTEVVVKHSAQKLFLFERVACEMESHGVANRASTVKKIVFWLGIYD